MKRTKTKQFASIVVAVLLVASSIGGVAAQTNDVTWSGEVEVDAAPATDGSQYQYTVSERDAVDNFTIDLTGSTATRWQSATQTTATDGSSIPVNVEGNTDPQNANVTITGTQNTTQVTESVTGVSETASHSKQITVEGEPTELSITADANLPGNQYGDVAVPASGCDTTLSPGESTSCTVDVSGYNYVPEFYIPYEHQSDGYGEATLTVNGHTYEEWSGDGAFSGSLNADILAAGNADMTDVDTLNVDISVPSSSDVDIGLGSDAGADANLGFQPVLANTKATVDGQTVGFNSTDYGDKNAHKGDLPITETVTVSPGTHTIQWSGLSTTLNYDLEWTNTTKTVDPSVSVGGETVSYSGTLADGATHTEPVSLTTGSQTASVSVNGEADVAVNWQERTKTENPSVEVNGNSVSYSGTLNDGETTTLSPDPAWVQEGTNKVNVSMAPVSGPTPEVGLDYDHRAADNVSVDYTGESWSEKYNVSHGFSEPRSDARLTVPFASNNVISVKSAEVQTNGGSWSDVSDYTFNDGTLVVPIGEVQAGDTVSVRTTGRKVKTENSSITILEPTMPGQALESKVQLDSWGPNAHIDVAPSSRPDKVYYTHTESWSDPDERTYVDRDTQQLRLPNASAGDTFYATTAPMRVSPVGNGDVVVSIPDQSDLSTIETQPGKQPGDMIEYTYESAESDTEYLLYSETNGVVVDSGTANSPITLTGSDDHGTLTFRKEDTNTTPSGGGGGGGGLLGGVAQPASEAVSFNADNIPLSGILTPILLLGGAIGLFVFRGRLFGGSTPTSGGSGGSGGSSGVVRRGVGGVKSAVGRVVSAGKRSVPFFGRVVKAVGVFIATIGRPIGKAAYKPLKPLIGRIAPNTGVSSGSSGTGGGMLRGLLGNPRVVLFGGMALAAVMLRYGIVAFSAEIEVLMVVVGTIIGSFVLLRWLSAFSWPLFGIVVGVVALLGAELVRPGSLLPRIGAGIEQIIPVLGLVTAYIAISWWRNRNKGGGGSSGGGSKRRVRDRIPGRRR